MMEYKTVILCHTDDTEGLGLTTLDERLNTLARQGWVLSALRQGTHNTANGMYYYPLVIMEREVQPK